MLVVYIWLYCLVWWLIQDIFKVLAYKLLTHLNLFGFNDTGMVVHTHSDDLHINIHTPPHSPRHNHTNTTNNNNNMNNHREEYSDIKDDISNETTGLLVGSYCDDDIL
mmetsp:Transcript_10893/g.15010  ORF Transcript_10893/g.15010 Transcript_10893/m.15010 type:complete len:108 (-) Transcript_10893:43-366(-)